MYRRRKSGDCSNGDHQARVNSKSERRCGFTIVELIGTLVLLGAVFTCSIAVLVAIARERRSTEQRQHALQYANHLLEHATARPFAELTTGRQQLPEASADLVALLPELDQQLEFSEPAEDGARRLVVSIQWKNQQGRLVAPVQLVTWVYPTGKVQP